MPRRVIFLIKSKACCFNYYIISIHQSIQDFSGEWGCANPKSWVVGQPIITARKRSLQRLCFYTCLSFCSRWGSLPGRGGSPCQGVFLLGGLQAHTWEVSGPTPGGSPGRHPGEGVSQDALRQTPPPADGYCCGRYASYWNAFLFGKIFRKLHKMEEIDQEERPHHCPWICQYRQYWSVGLIVNLTTEATCSTENIFNIFLFRL